MLTFPRIRGVGAIVTSAIFGMLSLNGSALGEVDGAPGILRHFDSRFLTRQLIELIVSDETTGPWIVVIPPYKPEFGLVFRSSKTSGSNPTYKYQMELRSAKRRLISLDTLQIDQSVALDGSANFSIASKEISESDMDLISNALVRALSEARIPNGPGQAPDSSMIYFGFDGYVICPTANVGTSKHLSNLAFASEEFVKSKDVASDERALGKIIEICRYIIEGRDEWVTPAR